VREQAPDAILADYHLHDRVEGLDALDELRRVADVPGALITADASDTLAAAARARGYALLRKPVKPAALRALLAALARQRERAAG
jgi:CheY-like chemotaxis protein